MGVLDFILYPVYLYLFYYLFKLSRNNIKDPVLKIYHARGFWIKALAVIAFAVFNSKISVGDSYVLYHVEGANICKLILKNFSNIKYLLSDGTVYNDSGLLADPWNLNYCNDPNNFTVVRIVTILSFFTFGKYLITCLIFSMLSYSGVWKLYQFFYRQYPHLHKQLALAILYLPTFVFWSSGILKDSLCTGAIGWLTYSLYEALFYKRHVLRNTLITITAAFILILLKIYILVSYVPFFLLYIALQNLNILKNFFVRIIVGLALFAGIMVGFTRIMNQLKGSIIKYSGSSITKAIENHQSSYADQANIENAATSNFNLGVEFDGSVVSLFKMAPAAVAATLYRPFLWESKKLSTLLSSFESLALMLLTLKVLWQVGVRRFFSAWRRPIIMYCICFSLFFALFVGATTPNFGTLCRYKIPCTPFYVIAMFLIQDLYVKQKEKSLLKTKQASL
jgi:hypothetical protein